jgi:prophage regulatory protein
MPTATSENPRLIRLPEVRLKTGKSRSGIYAAIQTGQFPAPVAIGVRARAWISSEVDRWIADRVAESRGLPSTAVEAR